MAELNRVEEYLLRHNSEFKLLTKLKQSQFQKVNDEIQRRLEITDKAKNDIKENTITISSISKATGISNKTFYNNELLKGFVEEFTQTQSDNAETIKRLKEKNAELSDQIKHFVLKDIDAEELKIENDNLCKEISMLQRRITGLEEQNEKLQKELTKSQNNGKIIHMPTKRGV